MAPKAETFRNALMDEFRRSEAEGKPYLDIRSGDLHRQVGGYPGHDHRMPVCCKAMRDEMQPSDEELEAPPKGNGASLVIRYQLPR